MRLFSGSSLPSQTGLSVMLKLFEALMGLAITILVARVLGAHGLGIYAYALALSTVLAVPVQFGVPALVVRETARSTVPDGDDRPDAGAVLNFGLGVVVLYYVLVATPLFAVIAPTLDRVSDFDRATGAAAMAFAASLAGASVAGASLRGLRCPGLAQTAVAVIRPSLFVFALSLVILAAWLDMLSVSRLSSQLVMLLHALAMTVALFVALIWVFRALPAKHSLGAWPSGGLAGKWMAAFGPLALTGGLYALIQHVDVLMLSFLGSAEDVGPYRVAIQLVLFTTLGLKAVETVFAAPLARASRHGDASSVETIASGGALGAVLLAVPVAAVYIVAGRSLLGSVFGTEFVDIYAALVVLMVGKLMHLAVGPCGLVLNMAGHDGEPMRWGLWALGLNFALNLALIPLLGTVGAALATAISFLFWNVAMWWRSIVLEGVRIAFTKPLYSQSARQYLLGRGGFGRI